MLNLYRILINFIFLSAPIILIIRILNKKEDIKRFKEKLGFHSKIRPLGKLIWFHASSVGELMSIIPLIEKFENYKNIKTILITTNTLSSSKIILKKKLKKTIHQFLPIDTSFLSNSFLKYWKPDLAIFVESEIWPNFLFNIKKKNIPLILLNGRFTSKSFNRWKKIPIFTKKILNNFDMCFIQNNESKRFLQYFNIKSIKDYGNLKFTKSKLKPAIKNIKILSKIFKNKKIWCASSTHDNEEELIGKVHISLKKNIKNLITIIIPRHINRVEAIYEKLKLMNLKIQLHSKKSKQKNYDIYLVDVYGETENFYRLSNIVFLGGSLIKHGGQNPIEPARQGCKIFHGPNIQNFREIYDFLKRLRISRKINNSSQFKKILLNKNNYLPKKINKHKYLLNSIGNNILNKTFFEIKKFL